MTVPVLNQGDSLWHEALASLHPNLRAQLGTAVTHKRDVLAAVLAAAEEKRQLCLRKRWKFKRSNGDEIVLRDVLEKIVKWVNLFKAVGDTAVQCDASNASLPWMAVRFLLQVAVNDVQVFGSMLNDLEVVSRLIARYRQFETVYLEGRAQTDATSLKDALTAMYAEVLTLLGNSVGFFAEPALVRIAKSTFRIGDHEQMKKIQTREAEVLKFASLVDSNTLRSLESVLIRLSDQTIASAKELDEQNRHKLLTWLSTVDYSRHHELRAEARLDETGAWLLRHAEYEDWVMSSSSSILLLHGIPGSGKSTLCSAVVDTLLASSKKQPLAAPFAYFYCADSEAEPERASPEEILRCILRQLAIDTQNGKVRGSLLAAYECRVAEAKTGGLDVAKLRLKESVERILDLASEDPLTIVIDALDEINEESRHQLLSALDRMVEESDNVVKIFLTSRNDGQIFGLLPSARRINITSEDTESDMKTYVGQQVDDAIAHKRMLNGGVPAALRDQVAERLISGAGEMFLWVKLQIDSLCRKKHSDDIIGALSAEMLDSVNDLYEKNFSRILEDNTTASEIATKTFSWLLFMKEPLRPAALITAVSEISEASISSPQELVDICLNLVTLDTRCDVLRFAHQSVQDFLRTKELFAPTAAHSRLAESCLQSCLHGPSTDLDLSAGPATDLYLYAALYWPSHYRAVEPREPALTELMNSFVFDEAEISLSFEIWLDGVQEIASSLRDDHPLKKQLGALSSESLTPLFLAAIYGLVDLMRVLLADASPGFWDQKNDKGHTALYIASAAGNEEAVSWLLEQGAGPNIECGRLGSALHAACFYGESLEVVDGLLQRDATSSTGSKFTNALEAAYMGGHESIAIFLIKEGSTIQSQEDYDAAVQGAALSGFVDVLNILQCPPLSDRYGAVPTQDKMHARTAKAIIGGQLGVLKRFLGRKPEDQSLLPPDAVSTAAIYGHHEILVFLLDLGMSTETAGVLGLPLRAASLMGHERVVQLLVSRGADIKANGPFGPALQAAAVRGHNRILQFLVTEGADVNQAGGHFGSALQAAAYYGHRDCVELLLDAGAEVHVSGFSRDAFHAAAEGGHHGIVTLLLDRGYKFYEEPPGPEFLEEGPCPYRNLLRMASPRRQGERDEEDYDWWARKHRREGERQPLDPGSDLGDIFQFLQGDNPPKTTTQAYQYWSKRWGSSEERQNYPLEAAAAAGHEATVKVLLAKKEAMGIPNAEVEAALRAAAKQGHRTVVRILFDSLPPTNPAASRVRPAILDACRNHDEEMAGFLLELVRPLCSAGKWDALQALIDTKLVARQYRREDLAEAKVATDFQKASECGDTRMVSIIFGSQHRRHLDIHRLARGFTSAAAWGHTETVQLFCDEFGANIKDLLTPETLAYAAGNGKREIVELLLPSATEMEHSTVTITRALTTASLNGHLAIVKILAPLADINARVEEVRAPSRFVYEAEADADASLITPLQAALRGFERFQKRHSESWFFSNSEGNHETHHQQIVLYLLDRGADPNDEGGRSELPLQVAARLCPPGVVEGLLRAGANPNKPCTPPAPIHLAVLRELDAAQVVKKLLEAGASIPKPGSDWSERVMAEAFKRFTKSGRWDVDGQFEDSPSVDYVLTAGAGAVIELLLQIYPDAKATAEGAGLLLQMAAFAGHHDLVRLLLDRKADVNSTGGYYGTPLQAAARKGHSALIEALIRAGADVNALQGEHQTAVRAASVGSHAEAVRLLIRHGADIHRKTRKTTKTVLDLAAKYSRNADLLRPLVEDVKLFKDDTAGISQALVHACEAGNVAGARVLIGAGASVSGATQIGIPIHVASAGGHVEVVRLLLDHGADANQRGGVGDVQDTPLCLGVASGSVETVQLLLHAGASVNTPGTSGNALIVACLNRQLYMLDLLVGSLLRTEAPLATIDEAMEVAIQRTDEELFLRLLDYVPLNETYIVKACAAGCASTVREFLGSAAGHNTLIGNGCGLPAASAYLRPGIVQLLLEHGADPKMVLPGQGSPLLAALTSCATPFLRGVIGSDSWPQETEDVEQNGKTELGGIEQLIAQLPLRDRYRIVIPPEYADFGGSGPSRQEQEYRTRLISCCEEIARLLVRSGVAPAEDCGNFGTALHLAAFIGSPAMTTAFLDNGTDVDIRGGYWDTALLASLWASHGFGDHTRTAEILLERGADVHFVHPELGTALHLACHRYNKGIVEKLLIHGADVNAENGEGETPLTIAARQLIRGNTMSWMRRGRDSSDDGSGDEDQEEETLLSVIVRLSKDARVQDRDVIAAAGAYQRLSGYKAKIFEQLYSLDEHFIPSDAAIATALKHIKQEPDARGLLSRRGAAGVTAAMLKACQCEDVMAVLLDTPPICPITPDIIRAQQTRSCVAALIGYDKDIPITEDLALAVLSVPNYPSWRPQRPPLEMLWERNAQLRVTSAMIEAAASSRTTPLRDLEFVLDRAERGLAVTSGALSAAAAADCREVGDMVDLLLGFDPTCRPGPESVLAALKAYGDGQRILVMEKLLGRAPEVEVSEAMFIAAFGGDGEDGTEKRWDDVKERRAEFVEAMRRLGRTVVFTERMRRLVTRVYQRRDEEGMREAILGLERGV
ncbi:ankyrin repeat-containing domain protein [Echria macrotheca]|uniref:Ankyrin repeat-containing domain protein n=1 Tax=Echria macrotheca TaxID=438768 RepID=A0AAJ0F663_9PEZI|nr:ankyrin repeat-containing domain protein [Echria macrotheca]